MDEGFVLLITIMMIMVTIAVLTTGIHIIRPGEIGLIYRGKKFLRHSGPAFVMGPPIIGKVYRIKAKSLHIMFESPTSSSPSMEILLYIADPSRIPTTVKDLDSEIRGLASVAVNEARSRINAAGNPTDYAAVAEKMRLRLDKSFEKIGLKVSIIKVGERQYIPTIGESTD